MRSLWTGNLAFGLVNIPIQLYSASKERAMKFKMLDKHGKVPIAYLRVRKGTHQEVPFENIVRGYEYEKGDYVVLEDDDFKRAAPRKSRTIDILSFADEKDIDPIYYEKPYYIEPAKNSEKAYVLLREAMARSGKVAICRFVMRDHEYIAAIKAHGRALVLNQLRFEDEIRPPKELNLPGKSEYSKRELDIALALIHKLEEHFKASNYEDEYAKTLQKIIKAKRKRGGKKIKIEEEEPNYSDADMRKLMSALKQSLQTHSRRSR